MDNPFYTINPPGSDGSDAGDMDHTYADDYMDHTYADDYMDHTYADDYMASNSDMLSEPNGPDVVDDDKFDDDDNVAASEQEFDLQLPLEIQDRRYLSTNEWSWEPRTDISSLRVHHSLGGRRHENQSCYIEKVNGDFHRFQYFGDIRFNYGRPLVVSGEENEELKIALHKTIYKLSVVDCGGPCARANYPPEPQRRLLERNRLGECELPLADLTHNPRKYWAYVVEIAPPRGIPRDVILRELFKIPPMQPAEECIMYQEAIRTLHIVAGQASISDWRNLDTFVMPYIQWEVVRIIGNETDGHGTFPEKVKLLLEDTGMGWAAVPDAYRRIPARFKTLALNNGFLAVKTVLVGQPQDARYGRLNHLEQQMIELQQNTDWKLALAPGIEAMQERASNASFQIAMKYRQIETWYEEIEEKITKMNNRITESGHHNNNSDLMQSSDMDEEHGKYKDMMAEMKQTTEWHSDRIEATNSRLTVHTNQISGMGARTTANTNQISVMEARLTVHTDQISDIDARVKELEDKK
ncbi:hypothetical protein GQX73_g10195 [Xylaria multiplex]|uniref:Uncharacterized protein n=1 Tax=Xylaria multiplex TaxID=323545 RepID=A0A7C8IH67_9PEZI|nr:hypothetical protein GQX73_g10195 [Xylaria multiplex]